MLHRNPDMSGDGGPALTDTDEVFPSLRYITSFLRVKILTANRLLATQTPTPLLRIHAQLENFPLIPFSAVVSKV